MLGITNKMYGVASWMNSAVPIIYSVCVGLWKTAFCNTMFGRICHETAYTGWGIKISDILKRYKK
jgi:hypothetical protein